jgi:hypothetical protein
MANHCKNLLEVRGDPERIDQVIEIIEGWARTDGNSVDELQQKGLDYSWGEEPDGRKLVVVEFEFTTAWEPERKLIEELAKKFVDFTFNLTYWESGQEFQGFIALKGGKVVDEARGRYYGAAVS